jgi:hypothetical protein
MIILILLENTEVFERVFQLIHKKRINRNY